MHHCIIPAGWVCSSSSWPPISYRHTFRASSIRSHNANVPQLNKCVTGEFTRCDKYARDEGKYAIRSCEFFLSYRNHNGCRLLCKLECSVAQTAADVQTGSIQRPGSSPFLDRVSIHFLGFELYYFSPLPHMKYTKKINSLFIFDYNSRSTLRVAVWVTHVFIAGIELRFLTPFFVSFT